MLKTLSRYFCFSLLVVFIACAPKPVIVPPPLYEERELTLEEIIAKAGDGTDVLKAIADITIEKNNEHYSSVSSSVLMKRPGEVHIRMYQLGMLVRDFIIKDDALYVLAGKNDDNLRKFGRELYGAIFWWDAYRGGDMSRGGGIYTIKTDGKEIQLDDASLLPVKQEIKALNKVIYVKYDEPSDNDGFWYPSRLIITVDDFTFIVKLKKLLKNPSLGEADFQVPAGI